MIKDLSMVLVILNDLLFTYSTNTVALRIPVGQPPVLVGFFSFPSTIHTIPLHHL